MLASAGGIVRVSVWPFLKLAGKEDRMQADSNRLRACAVQGLGIGKLDTCVDVGPAGKKGRKTSSLLVNLSTHAQSLHTNRL